MFRLNHPSEKGQSLVEVALTFTFLLLLVGVVIDLGMMFYTYLSLRDIAQEGAIYGSYSPVLSDSLPTTHPTSSDEIYQRIIDAAKFPINSAQIQPGDITVTCNGNICAAPTTDTCPGQKITVQIIYDYRFITPLLGMVYDQNIPLNSTVTDTILSSDATIAALTPLNQSCFP